MTNRTGFAVWVLLALVSSPNVLWSQPANPITPRLDENIARLQKFLSTFEIEAAALGQEMPLENFLAALEKQVPSGMTLKFRLDRDAFGKETAGVAGSMVSLPSEPKRLSMRAALQACLAKVKPPVDYGLATGEVIITLPKQARYRTGYSLEKLPNPELLHTAGVGGTLIPDLIFSEHTESTRAAEQAMRGLSWWLSPQLWRPIVEDPDAIQLTNGTLLEVNAVPAAHSEIYRFFRALHRVADVAAQLQVRVYEVNDEFYTKLRKQKRVPAEGLEKQAANGSNKDDALGKALEQQKPLFSGDDTPLNHETEAPLLSRYTFRSLLPGPDQVRQGDSARQGIFQGFELHGHVHISADRRYVRLKLREESAHIEEVVKSKVQDLLVEQKTGQEKETDAETPFMKEETHGAALEIPDGGTALITLHYRPESVRSANRWWVAAVQVRIVIEEEERQIRREKWTDILEEVVADVLQNPKLKGLRETHGSAEEKSYALVDSPAWKWTNDFRVEPKGLERTKPRAAGNRLLGMRVESFREPADSKQPHSVTLTLLNAGGEANGPALGGAAIRYLARPTDKGWTVELSNSLDH
jgi:hypothetical protein